MVDFRWFNPTSHAMRTYLLKGPDYKLLRGGMGDLVCVRFLYIYFFSHTSGDGIYFPDIQSYCIEGNSLQYFFFDRNQSAGYFF